MSGTVATIDTPLVGTPGSQNEAEAGASGSPGGSVGESAAPFGNEDFSSVAGLLSLTPEATGGAGGAGSDGSRGANGIGTTVYDTNFDATTTYTQGGNGGPGGNGAAGGDATIQMTNDSVGAVGATYSGGIDLNAYTAGGAGGLGATGGSGGSGGSNSFNYGTNPNTGARTTDISQGAAGGGGGAGGTGGGGGTATTEVGGLQSLDGDGTTIDIEAAGGVGGSTPGISGWSGAIGGETSAGGAGGAGGEGGAASATLANSSVADDYTVGIDLFAHGGNGGDGGNGGGGGVAEYFTSVSEPYSTYITANGANGGNGGAGGAATATLAGNTIAAPEVDLSLYADVGAGGAGGTGGSGGQGTSTQLTTYTNGTPGAAGNYGALGAGLLSFTDNTIDVGQSIAGDIHRAEIDFLNLSLKVGSIVPATQTGYDLPLDGGPGGNLVFSGNQFVGTGSSTLELQLSDSAGATIDTAANTLSIDGSPGNSMTGFTGFTLDNDDTFVAGTGNYTVYFQPDPDTLVYGPNSGNVTLEGIGSTTAFTLDFKGFGAGLSAATLPGDIATLDGSTFIDVTGHSSIELLGYTGTIPSGDVQFETVCYLAGTHILTPAGEVRVETLRPGNLVTTASGAHRPLRWVGHGRTLVTPRNRDRATPVVVRRGALADGVPHRDLYITRGHSLFLDGVLIPVEELVNHRSIAWVDGARVVEYYHLETDTHDVVLAEGAAAETYREDDNSPLFLNAATRPDRPPMPPYAPVLHDHPTVKRLWRALADRAGPHRLPLTDDPDLHLRADGVRVDAASVANNVWRFRLSGPVADLRIVSRTAIPAMIGLAQDQRRLGVALRRIVLTGSGERLSVGWDAEELTTGFHAAEPAERHRWTDGEAVVPAPFLSHLLAGATVALQVASTLPYPTTQAAAVAA